MRSIKNRLLLKGRKNKKTIITILLALAAMAGQAQTKVKGHVVNERGETVEYVSIGIEEFPIRRQRFPTQLTPMGTN